MPPPNYAPSDYMGAMDQSNYFVGLDAFAPVYTPTNTGQNRDDALQISELGTTAHPMQNQLQSLQAKIRSGAGSIEFEFAGKGKGSQQGGTPEMYGKEEREMMRKLAELNKVRTSTHATFNVSGLAGFGERGFSRRAQHETVNEVQRAIDFAKDASTGGAIVVHTGEWQRPVSHHYGDEGFKLYPGEKEEEQLLVVDEETGEFIQGVAKNRQVEAPQWRTAGDLLDIDEPVKGYWVGEDPEEVAGPTTTIHPDDWVDIKGRKINPNDTDHLFRRVPKWDEEADGEREKFATRSLNWKQIKEETKKFNEKTGKDLDPEVYFAQLQLDNQILQHRGQSLFHIQHYEQRKEQYDRAKEMLEYYKDLSEREDLSEAEKRSILRERVGKKGGIIPPKEVNVIDHLRQTMKEAEMGMRHTHESSSSADARAKELERRRDRLKPIEEVGLKRTAEAMSDLAMEAMEKTRQARKMRSENEEFEDLYIAPENWHPSQYGSHPEELLKIVQESREKFKEELMKERHKNEQEAEQLAKKHIKTTFDIGHLNLWRSMMEREPDETEEEFQEKFEKWVFENLEALKEEDALGHIHVTDNFGYNDDHVTIGQGNAPVKRFVDWMKDNGYKDFIVEAGSFNGETIMHDAWSYLGAVPWKARGPQSFGQMHNAHAGSYSPPGYIVGAYVPSNEWTLWTGVPLE